LAAANLVWDGITMRSKNVLLAAGLIVSQLLWALPGGATVVRNDANSVLVDSPAPTYEWKDDSTEPKAVVVFVHGLTQDGLSVDSLARDLARQHYLVVAMDQRGHGRWHCTRNRTPGSLIDYKSSTVDLEKLCRAARDKYPHLPLYCMGESCGSGVVAQMAARDPELVDGIVLCSPGTRPRVYNIFWMTHDFLCNVFRVNHPINVRRYIRKYASNDPRITDEMMKDPLARNDLSGLEILHTLAFIHDTTWAVKHLNDDMPLLVVQGAKDHILATSTVQSMVHHSKSMNKKLIVLPDCGHVLLGTHYIQPTVEDDIVQWLNSQVATQASISAQL
jgi:alpha-beta hydrolase superfamily lysophospholipase